MSNDAFENWLRGHKPLARRLNVRNTLRQLERDPLELLIKAIGADDRVVVVQSDVTRYRETYECYYQSLRRFLPEMSLAARWSRGPYYKLKYGGSYTSSERRLADAFNKIAPYLHVDFYNCLLWGRMLLDRTVALARYFLDEKDKPSFTSFADHKKFFLKRATAYGRHQAYAQYLKGSTSWFEMPLKLVRDRYVVHASPKHQRFFGYPAAGHELQLILIVPEGKDEEKPFMEVTEIMVGVPQMAAEIGDFLTWFAAYGTAAVLPQYGPLAG